MPCPTCFPRGSILGGVSRLYVPQSKRYQRLLRTTDTYKQNRRKQQQKRGSHWAGAFVGVSESRWVGMQEFQAPACEALSGFSFSRLKESASVPLFLSEKHVYQSSVGFLSVSLNCLLPLTWFVYRICQTFNKHGLIKQLMECYFKTASSCSKPALWTISEPQTWADLSKRSLLFFCFLPWWIMPLRKVLNH